MIPRFDSMHGLPSIVCKEAGIEGKRQRRHFGLCVIECKVFYIPCEMSIKYGLEIGFFVSFVHSSINNVQH